MGAVSICGGGITVEFFPCCWSGLFFVGFSEILLMCCIALVLIRCIVLWFLLLSYDSLSGSV